ncbi:MAG TPA: cytochrome c3 family protein [Pirellulales bacterium]|jgi:tetratricopeptide (TPR) repeat protein|nr:cytochrome c3 family protein [Pirellulales bacterium]
MRKTPRSSKGRCWVIVVGGGVLSAAAVLVGRVRPLTFAPPTSSAGPAMDDVGVSTVPVKPAVKPPPPPEGYVGSEVCAKCHTAIARTYAAHPMSHSAGRVPGEHEVENFDAPDAWPGAGNLRYHVERRRDQVFHHEILVDRHDQVVSDDATLVRLFIGSGTRGKTYAVERGGLLFESPISWFSSEGGKWDLSPGYERVNPRFDRRIGDQCVACHAGRMAVVPGAESTFREPLFLEAAIGCERCHGPGAAHAARQEAGGVGGSTTSDFGADESIVNPARLDPARSESICNQCHLQGKLSLLRYGRTFYDFRPGMLLDEVWTTVVDGSGVSEGGRTKAVSQVQQMRESACFRGSEGRFGCTSCHDSHWKPEPAAAAEFYRDRCLKCHGGAQPSCSLSLRERADDSCMRCHMPRLSAVDIAHASQTDHRVSRSPSPWAGGSSDGGETDWEIFGRAAEILDPWELDRVRGTVAIMLAQRDPPSADDHMLEAATLFLSVLRAAPDDVTSLKSLAFSLAARGRLAESRDYIERSLAIAPNDEKALRFAATLCLQADDYQGCLHYGERLLTVNLWLSSDHMQQAELLRKLGKLTPAIEHAEKALALDPTKVATRQFLVEAYRQAGETAESQRHDRTLQRLKDAE